MNKTFEELLKQHENTHFLEDGYYVEKLQQELQRKDKEIKHLKSELECYENGLYFSSEVE